MMRFLSVYKNYLIKNLKNNSFIKSIQKSIICNTCNGKGEIITKELSKKNELKSSLCPSCRGVGVIYYTYF
jgi:DnaJ-class molecular chaperone